MSDDVYSRSFIFNEFDCCEINGCNNKASEIIDIVIPWKHCKPGKWYLCQKCKQEWLC